FKKAVEAGASSGKTGAVIFFNLGALNYNKKRYRAAADAYEQALKLRPTYAAAHRELGYTYQELRDLVKARQHFVEYLKLSPQASDRKGISDMIKVMPTSG
ncbi:MAG: tetratricopeptide repeat protein, partial [Acidobacteriota bacterium]